MKRKAEQTLKVKALWIFEPNSVGRDWLHLRVLNSLAEKLGLKRRASSLSSVVSIKENLHPQPCHSMLENTQGIVQWETFFPKLCEDLGHPNCPEG